MKIDIETTTYKATWIAILIALIYGVYGFLTFWGILA